MIAVVNERNLSSGCVSSQLIRFKDLYSGTFRTYNSGVVLNEVSCENLGRTLEWVKKLTAGGGIYKTVLAAFDQLDKDIPVSANRTGCLNERATSVYSTATDSF